MERQLDHATAPLIMKTMPTQPKMHLYLAVVLGALAALISQAPARWVAYAIVQASHKTVLLKDPQGTIWQGSAQAVLAGGADNSNSMTTLPSRLQWTFAPSLTQWRLSLQLSLHSACCTPSPLVLHLTPSLSELKISVDNHRSEWPAQWLVGLGAPWNTIQPQGTLVLQTQDFAWLTHSNSMQGQLNMTLQNFSTQLSTLRPLGSYIIRLLPGANPSFDLSTSEGGLQLQGHGEWRQNKLHFLGEAFASEGSESAVSNLLNVLGQRQGNKALLKME